MCVRRGSFLRTFRCLYRLYTFFGMLAVTVVRRLYTFPEYLLILYFIDYTRFRNACYYCISSLVNVSGMHAILYSVDYTRFRNAC
jgi:hypothetical protein